MSEPTTTAVAVPLLRKLWVVVTLTCLLIPMPIAMIILLTGPVYRWRESGYQPIGNTARFTYGGLLVLWLVAATAKAMLQPGGIQGEWERSADPDLAKPAQTASASSSGDQSAAASATDDLPTCTDPQVIQTAREAIDESPAGVTSGLRVRDVGKGQETFYQPERKLRRCVAEVMLNSGSSLMTYQVLYGPSGNLMVQAQVGDAAVMQHEVDKGRKEEAEHQPPQSERRATDISNSPSVASATSGVMNSNELANICHDASGKDSDHKDNLSQGLTGRAARLGLVANTYSQQSETINAESHSRYGASEEITQVVIDTSAVSVPPSLKKGGRVVVEGHIEDSVLWGNVVDGCFVKLKATSIAVDGF